MEIDKLIEQLTERSHLAAMNEDAINAELLKKAAETIRLLRELAVEESNAKYKMLFDDVEENK